MKIDGVGGSRPKRARVARAGRGLVPPMLVWPLGLVSLTYSPLGSSHDKILCPKNPRSN
jgi:hypothetical protein